MTKISRPITALRSISNQLSNWEGIKGYLMRKFVVQRCKFNHKSLPDWKNTNKLNKNTHKTHIKTQL